ncbi:hypothetical protein BO70DRAFT_136457 [Aspergillus heteromorphus CBS 117.55]|uniref:Prion-inhibition and propagation HeLo domain-containing protein n=1 Tax=Aspergillus heteromorphus CBS 117.55 TaxID=1448321 RepID=A0A317WWC8_9EURO|nr:uncharacterized protein BO70DRAFT_136457 [Aspergillus heteromorphus CBS 117.55]PWY90201.1 hypothetical protein BO70DRAFT_136457 [Aspergillus heteromorphus CBS 117.55]
MDPISFAITIASVGPIFQTCLAEYECIQQVLSTADSASGMDLGFRIQRMRLQLWGRSRGDIPLSSFLPMDTRRQFTPAIGVCLCPPPRCSSIAAHQSPNDHRSGISVQRTAEPDPG